MHPHIHTFLPSSSPDISLECRIYLPSAVTSTSLGPSLSMEADSEPIPLERIDKAALRDWGINRLITAAHPWARLGGNMLFPVIAHHLPRAVYDANCPAAIATFNVRGVGLSEGSQPWPGWGIGSDGEDFGAVERAVLGLLGDVAVYRLGYSYGTNLVLSAPPPNLRRTMLVSPAPTLFKAMTVMCGPTFQQSLDAALNAAPDGETIWAVYGTSDEFTGVSTLRALGGRRADLIHKVEIEGCGHFYARGEDGRSLRSAIEEWIA
ncbi:uncharacterized protein CcaverHIS019_0401260 [Cutaneotrichosporon cavernicola]|uniref:AB hydrolase-1 domain-containing protein n=1 Tax=Cutaneotrichosporon cavernicola TaxID=279322 RepID=A0AA48QVH4_9TREE|nr:uncharacterized protein CcaverHIS019_0401260 [Cutaneotrichosporon cavernicola]BEI91306.1 hypothetical protein CcaverHIS019_0401260 [Cutaneotrichosporon cavernicola]BEI99079.1 hypothetical protein CcaverHIS631_0401220 [Cutaneotrichosporon cavernicola]